MIVYTPKVIAQTTDVDSQTIYFNADL